MVEVAAVLCVRDGGAYLENCLGHLVDNGVSYAVIDNGIDERGLEALKEPRLRRNLIDVVDLPYRGAFELEAQMAKKQVLFDSLQADWFIHLDADEIMHSYREGETLQQAIGRIDGAGATVINFDEFVFLPIDQAYEPGRAGMQTMLSYYFFQPKPRRLMRAHKRTAGLSVRDAQGRTSAGHRLFGDKAVIASETFALRHYMFQDQEDAYGKYTGRAYSDLELARGWHGNRVGRSRDAFRFPPAERLERLPYPDSPSLQRSDPKKLHYWDW